MDQDKIDQYRKAQLEDKKRKEEMDALKSVSTSVNNSANETKKQLEIVTKDIAKTSDIDQVIKELKEAQLASYLSAGQKSQIIMADSTDLGEAVSKLGTKLDALAESLGKEKTDTKLITAVKEELAKVVTALNQDNDTELVTAIQDLKSSFTGIEVNPVVNVPEPVINVDIPKIDFSPLIDALKPTAETKEIELGDYKAQDIDGDDVFQYIGFVRPDGGWYIIENDVEGGSIRYKFGAKNYSAAWKKYTNQNYKLLNEAIREI